MSSRVGRMRHPIELFEPARTEDGQGGFTRGDAKVLDAWAEIVVLKVAEVVQYDKLEQVRTHKANIRYDERFKQGMFITYDGRFFYIEGVEIKEERDRFMVLSLREGGPV